MALPSQIVSHDGYEQAGYEVPVLDDTALAMQKKDAVWRVKRRVVDGMVSYGTGPKDMDAGMDGQHLSTMLIDTLKAR